MPKLMPTLRHTKSEERLDSNTTSGNSSENDSDSNSNGKQPIESTVKVHIEDVSSNIMDVKDWSEKIMTEDDVWSQEDDEITSQYLRLHKMCERDAISQMSLESIDSREQRKFYFLYYSINESYSKLCL